MTAQQKDKPTDKRARLVQTAMHLAHRKGFGRTTLADIAEEAEVPLGNVYYYFKTKEAIGEMLIAQRATAYAALRREWDKLTDPGARLDAFIRMTLEHRHTLAQSGCPVGTLCAELHKAGGPLAQQASNLFADFLAWIEAQFRALGQGRQSRSHAIHLLSALQGATLLAHSFGDPVYIEGEAGRLRDWIRRLPEADTDKPARRK